jgi:hypothetical protein
MMVVGHGARPLRTPADRGSVGPKPSFRRYGTAVAKKDVSEAIQVQAESVPMGARPAPVASLRIRIAPIKALKTSIAYHAHQPSATPVRSAAPSESTLTTQHSPSSDKPKRAGVLSSFRAMGIRDRPTAPRSPWQKGHLERLIGSKSREISRPPHRFRRSVSTGEKIPH